MVFSEGCMTENTRGDELESWPGGVIESFHHSQGHSTWQHNSHVANGEFFCHVKGVQG